MALQSYSNQAATADLLQVSSNQQDLTSLFCFLWARNPSAAQFHNHTIESHLLSGDCTQFICMCVDISSPHRRLTGGANDRQESKHLSSCFYEEPWELWALGQLNLKANHLDVIYFSIHLYFLKLLFWYVLWKSLQLAYLNDGSSSSSLLLLPTKIFPEKPFELPLSAESTRSASHQGVNSLWKCTGHLNDTKQLHLFQLWHYFSLCNACMIFWALQSHLKLLPNDRVTVWILPGLKIHQMHFLDIILMCQFLTWVYLTLISILCINSVKPTVFMSLLCYFYVGIGRSRVQFTAGVN